MLSQDGRRAWAFLALLGGSGVFTLFAAAALYMLRGNDPYVFWLGMAAHVQLFLCLSGFMAMFVKRDLTVDTKWGKIVVKDQEDVQRIVEQNIRSNDSARAGSAGLRDGDEEHRDLFAKQDDR